MGRTWGPVGEGRTDSRGKTADGVGKTFRGGQCRQAAMSRAARIGLSQTDVLGSTVEDGGRRPEGYRSLPRGYVGEMCLLPKLETERDGKLSYSGSGHPTTYVGRQGTVFG